MRPPTFSTARELWMSSIAQEVETNFKVQSLVHLSYDEPITYAQTSSSYIGFRPGTFGELFHPSNVKEEVPR